MRPSEAVIPRQFHKDEVMKIQLERLIYNVEVQPGGKLTLPPELIDSVGEGHWTITVQPADETNRPTRGHGAFLDSYSPEDEELYDDCQRG
jgi:hypothetical protein